MGEWFLWIIGRIYLTLKYKNWHLVRKVRDEEYEGHFSNAGKVIFLRMIGLTGAIVFTIILIMMIILFIWKLITQGIDGLSVMILFNPLP